MRLPLEAIESECLKLIYSDRISQEESTELVIPDTCGDAGKILDVRGQVLINSKKSATESILITAKIEVDIIFVEEDGKTVRNISTTLPFELSHIVKGANEDTDIVASIQMCKLDARMLNPRKLLVRGEVNADVKCYNDDKFVLWEGLKNAEEFSIHLQQKEVQHSLTMDIGEKNFTVSDEYNMPSGHGGNAKIISCVTEICINDVKTVGNKFIFKAVAQTSAVFQDGNEIFCTTYESQFSQIIESDKAEESAMVNIIHSLLSADFVMLPDREACMIAANFKVCVQAVCTVNKTSCYISDAYSNKFPIELETQAVDIFCAKPAIQEKIKLEGALGMENVTIQYIYCGGVCAEISGDKINLTARICGVACGADGELMPIAATLRASNELGLGKNQHASVINICCCPVAAFGANISLDVTYCLVICEKGEVTAVCEIEIDAEKPVDHQSRPSLIILCAGGSTNLWAIAKKHCSTIEAITAANSLSGEFDETARPLLIPKV